MKVHNILPKNYSYHARFMVKFYGALSGSGNSSKKGGGWESKWRLQLLQYGVKSLSQFTLRFIFWHIFGDLKVLFFVKIQI